MTDPPSSPIEDSILHEDNKFTYTHSSLSRNPAFLEYSVSGEVLDMLHTFVPPALRGRGVAGVLVKSGLRYAASRNLNVRLTCWYTADYVKKYGSLGSKVVK